MTDHSYQLSRPAGGTVIFRHDSLMLCGARIPYEEIVGFAVDQRAAALWLTWTAGTHVDILLADGQRYGFSQSVTRFGPLMGEPSERFDGFLDAVLSHLHAWVLRNALLEIANGHGVKLGTLDVDADGLHVPGTLWQRARSVAWRDLCGRELVGGRWEIYARGDDGRVRRVGSCCDGDMNGLIAHDLLDWLVPRRGVVSDEERRMLEGGRIP